MLMVRGWPVPSVRISSHLWKTMVVQLFSSSFTLLFLLCWFTLYRSLGREKWHPGSSLVSDLKYDVITLKISYRQGKLFLSCAKVLIFKTRRVLGLAQYG